MTEPITAPTPAVDNAPAPTETPAPVAAETTPGSILDNAPASTTPAATDPPAGYWDGVSDDVKNHAGFEGLKGKIDSQDGLALSYLNLQSTLGQREEGGIKIPTDDSTPEERAAFREKMGVPETAGDYKWEGQPEGMELDTELLAERQAKLHAANYTQEQYAVGMDILADEINGIHAMAQENQVITMANTKEALEAEWGADYGKNVDACAKVAERWGVKEGLMENGSINQLPVMQMLWAAHLSTTADGIVKSPDSGYNRATELKAVDAQLAALDYGHRDRDSLMKRKVALSQ